MGGARLVLMFYPRAVGGRGIRWQQCRGGGMRRGRACGGEGLGCASGQCGLSGDDLKALDEGGHQEAPSDVSVPTEAGCWGTG